MSADRDSYYNRATTWALDEQASLRSSLRLTRMFAGSAVLIAVLEAFVILLLTPLKSVTPIPVLVDRQTGFVEVLQGDGRRQLQADAALTQSLLAQYVEARESFNITDVGAAYRRVALWSAGGARQDYLSMMPASNPQSPLRLYPRSTIVETRIKSISPIGFNVALVRFETRRHDQDGRLSPPRAWAAVVAYSFSDAPMSVEDRLVNPLGFQVVRYHKDSETLSPPDPAPQAVSSPSPSPSPSPQAPAAPVASATTPSLAPLPASAPATGLTQSAIFKGIRR